MAESTPLTDAFCDAAAPAPPDRAYVIYFDPQTRGFGLRVTKAGAKSFILDYRVGRLQRRYTIGSFHDPWKVAAARRRALELKKLVDEGRDPQSEKNEARSAPTLNELIKLWREVHAPKNRPRSQKENEGLVRQWIKPELGTRLVAQIRRVDIQDLHDKITFKAGTKYRANRVLALLSRLFTLAIEREMRSDNPCRGVARNHEEGRTRYLTSEELGRLITALAEHKDRQGADVIRLLLLTGCRTDEALTATWKQFDLSASGRWVKPSAHTKQRREHRVPLSAPVLQLIDWIKAEGGQSEFLFPSGDGHRKTIRWSWHRLCQTAGLRGVRIHDLRHSFASYLASTGYSLPIIGALLGHVTAQTTHRYSHLLDDPLRQATERVGAIVTAGGGPGAEIVPLARRQGAV